MQKFSSLAILYSCVEWSEPTLVDYPIDRVLCRWQILFLVQIRSALALTSVSLYAMSRQENAEKGSLFFFSESSHVAYQINENEA